TTTTTSKTLTPTVVPPTDLVRVVVSVRLTNISYTPDLADKTSDEYKRWKTSVVYTLTIILEVTLGKGNFAIVDVTFSEGSIVVSYELTIQKAVATDTLATILDTVKNATKDGRFGNYTVDPDSVTAIKTPLKPSNKSGNVTFRLY
ncbi:hypothetical protein LSAT2_030511, partial [Lamellibrachia satsuma]